MESMKNAKRKKEREANYGRILENFFAIIAFYQIYLLFYFSM